MSGNKSKKHQGKAGRIVLLVILLLLLAVVTAGIVFTVRQLQQKQEKQRQEIELSRQEAEKKQTEQEKNPENEADYKASQDETGNAEVTETPSAEQEGGIDLSHVNSTSLILMRVDNEEVLAEKEADKKIYPASMTKMMTAIVALENLESLDTIVSVDRETYDQLYLEGASLAGFQPGDEIRAIDMIYGLMLPSGGECCIGLAKSLFGSEEAFVEKMNQKAEELGMANTHFVTSSGLHDPDHYTTVRDLTILLRYALQNETFRTVYCTPSYTTAPLASAPEGLSFRSTMFKNLYDSQLNGGEILGGKTGFTDEAGLCLASMAVVHDVEYILVTAGAPPVTETAHVHDAVTIYNQIK